MVWLALVFLVPLRCERIGLGRHWPAVHPADDLR